MDPLMSRKYRRDARLGDVFNSLIRTAAFVIIA
jgi:hypothetical protein